MKKILLLGSALVAATSTLFAQTLTPAAAGISAQQLFTSTPGFTITGLGFGSGSDIFYLETDGAFMAPTRLYRRDLTAGTVSTLFTYTAAVFGSFVEVTGDKVYFGENSNGTVRSVNLDGSLPQLLATVPGNYDFELFGTDAYLSANPGGFNAQNTVTKLTIATGATDVIVNTADFSGPITFDQNGALFYGATGFAGVSDLYRFTAAEVATAFGPTTLSLDAAHRVLANGGNSYFDFAGAQPNQTRTFFGNDGSRLARVTGTASESYTEETIAVSPHSIGHIAATRDVAYVAVTDFATNRSAVYSVVPEPGSTLLLAAGGTLVALRRRRDLQ